MIPVEVIVFEGGRAERLAIVIIYNCLPFGLRWWHPLEYRTAFLVGAENEIRIGLD